MACGQLHRKERDYMLDFTERKDNLPILTYTVEEIAVMLNLKIRTAYHYCGKTQDFKVVRIGSLVRVHKESFDRWFQNL